MKSNYSYFIRKKGRYFQLILRYKDNAGQWRQKTKSGYKNKRDITGEEKEALLKQVKGLLSIDISQEGVTLRQFSESYLDDQKSILAYNTYISYKNALNRFPALLDMPMSKITYSDCMHAISALNYSYKTCKNSIVVLKTLFKAAVRYKVIAVNVLTDYVYKSLKRNTSGNRIRTFNQAELDIIHKELFSHSKSSWIICYLMEYCGLRVNEALAVTVNDFNNKELTVDKQWGKGHNGKYTFKPLKTKNSHRKIPIPQKLHKALQIYLDQRPFSYMDGRLTGIKYYTEIRNTIIRITPNHSPHDFRHTYATNLLANGVDIRTVASLLGDTVTTVEQVYLHYTEEMREKAANDIQRIFG